MGGPGKYGMIDMGGMFAIKIRDKLAGDGDPGWYDAPAESMATEATAADLARDGIVV